MGVTGLWRLIEPAGKPVPVETLENKVLAVDISIWLHQMVKGYQDAKGAPLPNAHLMGLFQRLCKLLYFRVKPVFVFDGGFPDLKKETIARRQDHKAKYNSESERLKRELALLLSKKTAISSLLGNQILPKKNNNDEQAYDDMFKLPPLPQKDEESVSDSEDETNSSGSIIDVHSVDIQSENFKNLPLKEKYDLLIELKETRKMNSWGKLHELPKKSDNFSDFQLQRLLKRRKVQECLEETEKEMGDSGMSLNELESLLNEEGIDTKIDSLPTRRIAANDTTRYLLINNVKQVLADAKKKNKTESKASTSKNEAESKASTSKIEEPIPNIELLQKDELDEDLERAIKMSLECVNEMDTSGCTSKTDESWTSCLSDTGYSDSEDDFDQPDMSSAKAYIMQFSDFTNNAIDEIVTGTKAKDKNTHKISKVDKVLDEINKEKLFITSKLDLLSDHSNLLSVDNSSNDNEIQDKNTYKYDTFIKKTVQLDDQNIINATKSSIAASVNTEENIVILDSSSIDENDHIGIIDNKSENVESDSSEEYFEEVPEINMFKTTNTVVQLSLNTNSVTDCDDIFADVFNNRNKDTKVNNDIGNTKTELHLDNAVINNEPLIAVKAIKLLSENIADVCDKYINVSSKPETLKFREHEETVDDLSNNSFEPITIHDTNITSINPENTKHEQSNRRLSDTNNEDNKLQPLPTEKLNSMAENIQIEEQDLLQEKGRLDRVSRNITKQMTKEVQELLQIFGIPYIVAPMEAEAQCAFLESVKLTDGTITDDSDIWLFGGRTVYKNFFNQKKHVLQFLADRIEKSFNLNREQLILLALLVGSDYTTGVNGIGPVTALEILASFPFNKKQLHNENDKQTQFSHIVTGLQDFKKWVRAGKRTDNTSLKKKLKNVTLGDDFPSIRVVRAYLEPNIEKSEDRFTWGELDITILRDYTKIKFGWSQNKLDEIIKPVLKRLLERKSQRTVEDFFKRKVEFQSLEDQMSKRVKAAVQRMGLSSESDSKLDEAEEKAKQGRKRKTNKHDGTSKVPAKSSKGKVPKKDEESVLKDHGVKVLSQILSSKSGLDIKIPKTDYVQEIIPQRERDKQCLLQNKLKAIEIFRKTIIDRKKKVLKKKTIQPKQKADLSESDSE